MRDPERVRSRRFAAGVFLVVLGLALFLALRLNGPSDAILLLVLGAAFLAAFFSRRVYGFLVPGCILAGMGLGELGDAAGWRFPASGVAGMGVGFLALYVIDRATRREAPWWPLIPGGILVGGEALSQLSGLHDFLLDYWPLILVALGLGLMGLNRRGAADVGAGPLE